MVRTKADGASRDKYGGGNSYCPRPTPPWQKEISGFLVKASTPEEENQPQTSETASSSDASDSGACGSSSS
ncbi:hypothetical protein HPB52_019897 [Rhipicephalus sanguineus]|uniref:PCNA-associated factor n=1 Tax=Rhipicephalus sanguineus TaxID=34632 RepID=A0A9D4Q2M2_RHISA|nr:hypothetical protein HPB52_019897 [Rhipicephalus sanguineus]